MTKRLTTIVRYSAGLLRSLMILLLLIGFTAHSGGTALLIQSIQPESEDGPVSIPLLQSSEYCESNPVSMTPSGYPGTGDQAFLATQVTLQKGDGSNRLKTAINRLCQTGFGRTEIDFKSSVINSSSLVSSTLGRQFRLVGAKPSGTS